MATPAQTARTLRFGSFQLDLAAGELLKSGKRIRLQQQPFQLLVQLLEKPGEVVTREELQHAIWPADTFVDFEEGLGAAVYKLRQALGDAADNPRYIETIPRRGFRFIAPVQAEGPLLPTASGQGLSAASTHPARTSLTASRTWRFWWAGILAVLCTAGAIAWWRLRPKPVAHSEPPNSIAVLPFKNLDSEPNADYFSDGLTGELINRLSQVEGLQVKSQTSSFALKDKPRDVHQVGAALGINLVLEGSVLRSGNHLRVNAQLVRVADDSPLWAGRYDRELKDVFAIQDEISRSIVNELRLRNVGGPIRHSTSPELYDLYLRARALAGHYIPAPDKSKDVPQALPLLREVVAKDPDFAPGQAALAEVLLNLMFAPKGKYPEAYGREEEARTAIEQALRVDPLLPEALCAMGMLNVREAAWDQAEQNFRHALQLNPNLPQRKQFALYVLLPRRKFDEAIIELRKALALDPLSRDAWESMIFGYYTAGRYAEALDTCTKDTISETAIPKARILIAEGKFAEAISILEPLPPRVVPNDPSTRNWYLAFAYNRLGRRRDAERVLAEDPTFDPSKRQPWTLRRQAMIDAGLQDSDGAIRTISAMLTEHDVVGVDWYPLTYEFAFLRGDPRWNELRHQRSLPPIPRN